MPDTSLLFGPFLLGGCLNLILYGVCVLQTFLYYFRTYDRKDTLRIRLLVAYLFVMETIDTVCIIGLLYEPMVLNYGDPISLQRAPLLLVLDPILTVLISTPAQLFTAWRLKIVSQSAIIPLAITGLALVSLGGTKLTALVAMNREYSHFATFKPTVIGWLVSSAVADFLITSALTWSLFRRKSAGTGLTEEKVSMTLRLMIQTGFVTVLFAAFDLGLFVANSNSTLNFIPDFPLSKLYTNSLLSTLNARAGWNIRGQAIEANVLFQLSELSTIKSHHNQVANVNERGQNSPSGSIFVIRSLSEVATENVDIEMHAGSYVHSHGASSPRPRRSISKDGVLVESSQVSTYDTVTDVDKKFGRKHADLEVSSWDN